MVKPRVPIRPVRKGVQPKARGIALTIRPASGVSIKRTSSGELIINGKHQRDLVNQYPQTQVRRVDLKTHLSPAKIAALVRDMKVS